MRLLAARGAAVVETISMVTTPSGNLLHQLSSRLPYMAPAIRQIAEFILRDPETAQTMTITTLSSAAGVADSTVSRFVRELGLDSYRALRLGIAEATFVNRANAGNGEEHYVYEGISRGDDAETIVGKVARSSQEALHQTSSRVSPEAISAAVDLIDQAEVLVFFAMGLSSIAAESGAVRFTRAGKKCLLYRDQSMQVMSATVLTGRDVVIALSDSGLTTATVNATRIAREQGARTIGITSGEGSPLVSAADVTLFTANVPGGGLYGESVTSKWGQLLIVDTLYAAYASRHFDDTLAHLEETYTAAIVQSRST